MASTFPEVVKSWPPVQDTAVCDLVYRPYASDTTYTGKTSVNSATLGSSNLVYCTRSTPWKPGRLKCTRFQARKQVGIGTHDRVAYNEKVRYPAPMCIISGQIASMYGPSIADQRPTAISAVSEIGMGEALINATAGAKSIADDVGLMAAEARETLEFLRNPVSSLVKNSRRWYNAALRSAGGRKGSHGSRQIKAIYDALADTWMSYRYGLTPLMQDITGLLDGLDLKQESYLKAARASNSIQLSSTVLESVKTILWLKLRMKMETTSTLSAAAVVYYRDNLSVSNSQRISEALGLNAAQALSTAYELVQLSFVLDWFYGVGNFIRAVSPMGSRKIQGNSISLKEETVVKVSFLDTQTTYSNWPKAEQCTATHWRTTSTIDRRPNQPLPCTPQWNHSLLGLQRSADSLALLWQRLPGIFTGLPRVPKGQ